MIPGMMDRFITWELETTSINSVGTSIETYATLRTDFASIKYARGGTEFDEGAHPFSDIEFSVRWATDIASHKYKLRILYDGEYYKIIWIEKIGRQDGLRYKCILWDD